MRNFRFFLSFFVFAVSGVPAVFADADYSVTDILKKENEIRRQSAEYEFYFAPRKSTLFLSAAGMRLFGMGADAKGCTGWGGAMSAVFQKNADDIPDVKLLIGAEAIGVYAWGSYHGRDRHFESLNLSLAAGMAYDFTRKFSAGCLFGYSFLGLATCKDEGEHFHVALSSAYSVRPYVEYNFNPNSAVYLGYRFFYVSSWTNVEAHSNAIELGYRLRF
ncbi:MAG: hypothetical protein K6B46_00715 [Opitutales bacterium]|nr:hypothetical protein [Opitutales bacterium]